MDRPDQTTHFGFRDVPLGDKQTLVNDVFHSVAKRYDLMNDLMSAGLHRVWKDLDHQVSFVEGNAEALAFPNNAFDAYTIAFGIRNVPRIDLALSEAYRVLKPGSRFLCLEFSTVDIPGLDRLYDLFSFKVIPPLGRAVTGDAESYQYLVESIRKFPKPAAFAEMVRAAGFARVNWQALSGGIVVLHSGWRL
jgi:demethylmenaquinone methyltransferase / 2-methoxy-6-polyprenyl-1,4-benzoquinol methylase